AGNVTFLPPSRRSHTAKPIKRSPLSGPLAAPKITSASASFPWGLLLVFGRIVTDITSPLPLDMTGLHETPRTLGRRRWLCPTGRCGAQEQGWDAGAAEAPAWTKTRRRPHHTECLAHRG